MILYNRQNAYIIDKMHLMKVINFLFEVGIILKMKVLIVFI